MKYREWVIDLGDRDRDRDEKRLSATPQLTRTDSIRYQVGPAAASAADGQHHHRSRIKQHRQQHQQQQQNLVTRTDSIRYQVGPDSGQSRSWTDIERLLGNLGSKVITEEEKQREEDKFLK